MRDRSETPLPHPAPGPVRLSVPILPTPATTQPRQAGAPPDAPPHEPPHALSHVTPDGAASLAHRTAPEASGPRVSTLPLRFRTDAIGDALARRAAELALPAGRPAGGQPQGGDPTEGDPSPSDPPRPGDAWRIHWASGQLAGYAICCPECGEVHCWTTARGCRLNVDARGECEHRRDPTYGSCWVWAGAAEEGMLSASPSLDTRELDEQGLDGRGLDGRGLDGHELDGREPAEPCAFAGLLRSGWLVW